MEYNENAFIKLNRKIKNWEWYTDVNTAHFFIYCILTANWKDDSFHGMEVKRGQFIRTLENISRETGLSIQNIRTAIKHLISTQELTQNQHGKYRIFTVVKYEQYQLGNTISNNELTRNQHESNTKVTQSKEVKNIRTKEVKKELSKDNSIKNTFSLTGMIEEKEYPEQLKEKIKEWLKYKSEKKQSYKQTGFNVFLGKVDKALEQGCDLMAVIDCFDNAMSHNWSGVFFDKILNTKKQDAFNEEEFLRRFEDE